MKLTRKSYTTRQEKVGDFLIGIGIWHAVNLVMTLGIAGLSLLTTSFSSDSAVSSQLFGIAFGLVQCLPWIVNIALLIYFGITRAWIMLGMLATMGFYFVLALCIAVIFAVACFATLGTLATPR